MKADYHIHTEYSYDSKFKAKDLIAKAIQLDYQLVAITEHLDLLPQELTLFGLPSFRSYLANLDNLRAIHASHPLRLLSGVEIGDYHQVRDFANDFLSDLSFDIKLGAVHFLSDHTNVAIPLPKPLDPTQIEDYYRQNLALVSTCDIQVLAHLGVYKRYYTSTPDESHCLTVLKDIFQTMIARNIALELNYSAFRKTYHRLLPEPEHIDLYRSLGGNLFTTGSDAHQLDHFDDFYSELPAWLTPAMLFRP